MTHPPFVALSRTSSWSGQRTLEKRERPTPLCGSSEMHRCCCCLLLPARVRVFGSRSLPPSRRRTTGKNTKARMYHTRGNNGSSYVPQKKHVPGTYIFSMRQQRTLLHPGIVIHIPPSFSLMERCCRRSCLLRASCWRILCSYRSRWHWKSGRRRPSPFSHLVAVRD